VTISGVKKEFSDSDDEDDDEDSKTKMSQKSQKTPSKSQASSSSSRREQPSTSSNNVPPTPNAKLSPQMKTMVDKLQKLPTDVMELVLKIQTKLVDEIKDMASGNRETIDLRKLAEKKNHLARLVAVAVFNELSDRQGNTSQIMNILAGKRRRSISDEEGSSAKRLVVAKENQNRHQKTRNTHSSGDESTPQSRTLRDRNRNIVYGTRKKTSTSSRPSSEVENDRSM
jgi:hypothetical protein